jgi:acyl-CoA thioesterase YciA
MIDTPCKMPDLPPVLKVIPMPSDANQYGDVFGGWTMGHIDLAGAVLGHQVARGRIATVAVNTIQFHQPVSVGDIVTFFAEVEKRGRTSLTIKVQMYAERHPANPVTVKVTEALITYVALNADGSKRELPTE